MINKVSGEWSRLEDDARRAEGAEAGDLEQVLGQIRGVAKVLQRMSQVSVTRTTLRSAVREALIPLIRAHRDDLFPEIAELRRRLDETEGEELSLEGLAGIASSPALPDDLADRLESFESRIERLARAEEDLRSSCDQLGERIDAEGETRRGDLGSLESTLDEQLRGSVLTLEEKVGKVQEYLGRLETSIPETARSAAGEVEDRLRKEIETMVEQLGGKLVELQEMLRRMEEFVPRRELIEALDARLERLEGTFSEVAGKVDTIESATPEVRGLGDRFSELRERIAAVSSSLDRTAEGMDSARDALGARLDELQGVLRGGIDRWESDQSQVLEKLAGLRDSLRDQLGELGRQVDSAQSSIWGKITRKDPGLKLTGSDFEELSGKLEGIIGGLESIIARKNRS